MRLKWGELPPMYDQGVDHGVLYLDETAHPWNGLVSVQERDTGSVDTDHYFDGNRIHISQETGDFEGTINAYTYPDAFAEYNGYSNRQTYKRFGFAYRTEWGDAHKIHLIYNALIRDDERAWVTDSNSPSPSTFSWDIYGSSVPVPGASPASRLTLEAPRDETVLAKLEDILYGTDTSEPRLPDPAEIIELYESATMLRIVYNGDGTYTASGPDSMVTQIADGSFRINAPTAFLVDEGIFTVHSY